MGPRMLLALATLATAGLAVMAETTAPPTMVLASASTHEGERVTVAGVVVAARAWPSGDGSTYDLQAGGHALTVRSPDSPPPVGAYAQVHGLLRRVQGRLGLDEEGRDVQPPPGTVPSPAWEDVARDPVRWQGSPLRLQGTVTRSSFGSGATAIRLGTGPWPANGSVEALGALRYDGACLCHRFDAWSVTPWPK